MIAIQALHQAIADHQDPAAKKTLASCLQNMLGVQQQDMQQQAQGPQQAQGASPILRALGAVQ